MKNCLLASITMLFATSSIHSLHAQSGEFETSYNARFLQRNPLIGKLAPDVQVYDASGNPFRLAQSRGKHTVVVFGCLT